MPDGLGLVLTHLLAGLALGALCMSLLAVTQPFAREPVSRGYVLILVPALLALTFVAARHSGWTLTGVLVAAVSSVVGGVCALLVEQSGSISVAAEAVLLDHEVRRPKADRDRWVLVIGPAGAGKSTLVDLMGRVAVAAPARSEWHTTGPVRLSGTTYTGRVTEIPIERQSGECTLRFWERDHVPNATDQFPSIREIDAIIVVADPTQLTGIATSFPAGIRDSPVREHDANVTLLDIATKAQTANVEPTVWLVVSKPDLLRFSIHPRLVGLPIHLGPRWRKQMATMQPQERRDLVGALGVERALDVGNHFSWGAGNPLVAYARPADGRSDSFGHDSLLDFVVGSI